MPLVFRIAELQRRCDKANMTARSTNGAQQDRAFFARAMFLSLLLVFVTAHARPSGPSLQPAFASLAAVHGVEAPAILTSAAKVLRTPDLRQSGDPVDVASACAPPRPTLNGIVTTALWAPDVPDAVDAYNRPEPRAPPFA